MGYLGSRGVDDDNEEDHASYCLKQGTIERHLRMDSAAAAAVTLLPDAAAPHQFGSLYDVLNRCDSLTFKPTPVLSVTGAGGGGGGC